MQLIPEDAGGNLILTSNIDSDHLRRIFIELKQKFHLK
jgi:hypothetical protein